VADLEKQASALESALFGAGANAAKASELLAQKAALEKESEKLYKEWDELEALLAIPV